MNNLILERIKSQEIQKTNNTPVNNFISNQQIYTEHIPILELKEILNKLFKIQETKKDVILDKENIISIPILSIKEFTDLFNFVEWYLNNENKFNEKQQIAIKTLVQARDLINVGCACKRPQRFNAAVNYFKIFWLNNIKSDLMPTLLKACNSEKVILGDFLQYP